MRRIEALGKKSEVGARRGRARRHAEDPDAAAVGRGEIEHALDQRRLARAVAADEREELASPHRNAEIVERRGGAESLGHRIEFQRGSGRARISHRDKVPQARFAVNRQTATAAADRRHVQARRYRRGEPAAAIQLQFALFGAGACPLWLKSP
jgi:hypothetical protein